MQKSQNFSRLSILIIILVIALLIGLFFSIRFMRGAQAELAKIRRPMTPNERVIKDCTVMANEYLPGQCAYSWDEENLVLTLYFWDDSFKNAGISAKSGNKRSLESWESLRSVIVSLSKNMQQKFIDENLGTSVVVCAVDPGNHDTVFIMANNGKLLYDAAA